MFRRTTVLILEVMLAIVVAAVIAVAFLAWRLSEGPIEVSWVRGHLERALSDSEAGIATQVGRTTIAMNSWNRAFDVIAEDVSVIDSQGAVRARIGTISVALSPEALLTGRIAPKRVDILNPMIAIVRDASGHWTVTPHSNPDGAQAKPLDLAELVRPFAGDRPRGGVLSYLRAVEVRGASVRFVDDARGRSQTLSDVAGGVDLVGGGVTFRLRGRADWLDAAPTPISLNGEYMGSTDRVRAAMRFDSLAPAVLADLDPRFARLADIGTVLSGQVEIEAGLDGSAPAGNARLTIGPGHVAVPEVNEDGYEVRGGSLTVDIARDGERITLDGSLDIDGILVAANTRLRKDRAGYAVILDAVVSGMPVDDIERFWPAELADGAREWVTANLRSGRATSATLRAEGWVDANDLSIHALDTMSGRIDFEGVETHYFRPLPPVVDTRGSATFDATRMDIAVESGRLGSMVVEPTKIALINLDRDTGERADIEAIVRGPVREALELLDHQPLGYAKRIGLDAQNTAGEFGARLRFDIPLIRTLKVEEIGIAASANVHRAVVPSVLRGQDLTDGDLAVEVTGVGMSLSGTARIAGISATVSHEERFQAAAGRFRSRSTLVANPTVAELQPFGLDMTDRGSGTIAIEAAVITDTEGALNATIDGDLHGAALALPEIGWTKPAETAGILRLDIHRAVDGHVSVPGFEIRAANLFASGSVDFPDAGGTATDLARFRFGRTDAAGHVEQDADGTIRIAIEGPVIDLVPLVSAEPVGDGGQGALEARFAAGTLHLLDGVTLTNGTLSVRRAGQRIETLGVIGDLGSSPLRLVVQPAQGRRLITVATPDAGAFLKAFDIADTVRGGRLRVDGELLGDGFRDAMTLAVRIDDFQVVDTPVFAKVLSVASLTGLFDAISGEGIRFARATGDFALDKDTVRVDKGLAYGPGLGLKVEGTVGRTTDTVDVEGLIAPAYSLSRLIDVVPVLGELLTGGEGEGLLATSFAVHGTADKPQITVNPLTALAPGFVRDLIAAASRPADGPVTWTPVPPPGLGETRGR